MAAPTVSEAEGHAGAIPAGRSCSPCLLDLHCPGTALPARARVYVKTCYYHFLHIWMLFLIFLMPGWVQAVFVALDICRQSSLRGVAYLYAAYTLLQHMFGDTYASQRTSKIEQETDEDMDAPSQRTLLDAVAARCEFLEHHEETQLLIALQRAIHELQEWQQALCAMDQLARFSRAVIVAANSVLMGPSVAEALSAVAAVGSREVLGASCYVPPHLFGEIGVELCVCACNASHDGPQAMRDMWGSSAAVDAPAGMLKPDATALASEIADALNGKLLSNATWQNRGLREGVRDSIDVQVIVEPIAAEIDQSDKPRPTAVRLRVALSGAQFQASMGITEKPEDFSDAVAVCLDVIATSIIDLLRYDSC